LFVLDEVQTGVGLTGTAWAYQQLGLEPDIVAFAKKVQLGGIMAGRRVDEVVDNVFAVPGRINSTWGGGLADMVRSRRLLEIIDRDRLIEHAAQVGGWLLGELVALAERLLWEDHVLVLPCGERSIRFRPTLDVTEPELEFGLAALDRTLTTLAR